jgi:transcriptional regulator with XRE-family HTH domain
MDSKDWSAERKANAGRTYANRLAKIREEPAYRARRRREAVASNLAVAIAESDLSRARVAERAGIKPAQLSRQLGGSVNLTLDSIGRICEAAGWAYDVVFRRPASPEALQPWQQPAINRATVLRLIRDPKGIQWAAGGCIDAPKEAANGDVAVAAAVAA